MPFVQNSLAYSGRLNYLLGIKKPSGIDALIRPDDSIDFWIARRNGNWPPHRGGGLLRVHNALPH